MKKKHKIRPKHRQSRLLGLFWIEWFKQETNRLELLRTYAEKVCKTILPADVARARRKFERGKHGSLGMAGHGMCQACYQPGPRVWHHIIQLQHGGVNRSDNVVRICEQCHARIHPWLQQPQESLLPDEAYKPIWG